jgi:hypothetical protein
LGQGCLFFLCSGLTGHSSHPATGAALEAGSLVKFKRNKALQTEKEALQEDKEALQARVEVLQADNQALQARLLAQSDATPHLRTHQQQQQHQNQHQQHSCMADTDD